MAERLTPDEVRACGLEFDAVNGTTERNRRFAQLTAAGDYRTQSLLVLRKVVSP